MARSLSILAFIAALAGAAVGQQPQQPPPQPIQVQPPGLPSPDDAQAKLKEWLKKPPDAKTAADPFMPAATEAVAYDPVTRERYMLAMSEYYAYRARGYVHRQRVFEWQFFSSKVIFVVVLFLVISGVGLAAIQFFRTLPAMGVEPEASPTREGAEGTQVKDAAGARATRASPQVSEIVASLKEIRVSSPVLGVVILTLSLAFFYLYLAYVYPIVEIF